MFTDLRQCRLAVNRFSFPDKYLVTFSFDNYGLLLTYLLAFLRAKSSKTLKVKKHLNVSMYRVTGCRFVQVADSYLPETLDDATSALDSGEGLDMVFLDYKKAFDSVPHQRLVHKLKSYGFGDRIIQWVANFLNERKQIVTVRGHSSKPVSVLSGVPQGSVLGPLLFILYVNELPELVSSKIRMFADDTKVYTGKSQ